MNKNKSVKWIVGGMILTAIGFIVIPPLINRLSTKLYKASLTKDKIDIEGLEPEIVKKEKQ